MYKSLEAALLNSNISGLDTIHTADWFAFGNLMLFVIINMITWMT